MRFLVENFRWVFAGMVLTFASSLGQTFFISIFAAEIQAHYKITNGEWGGLYALGTFASGMAMIWAGGLTDRFRARALAMLMLAGLAAFALALAFNPYVGLLPIIIFGLRFCGQGMMFHIGMVAMARWFNANRGKAIAFATMGFSLGEAFLPLVFVALLGVWGFGPLWAASALFAILLIGLMAWLLKSERRPADLAKSTQAFGMGGQSWTRTQALRHPLFWFMAPNIMATSAFTTALFFQQVHIAEIKGWAHLEFVALFPFYSGLTILAVFFFGWAVDRFKSARLMAITILPMVFGFWILGYANTLWGAMAAFALLAIKQGASSTVPVAFWSEVYGTKHVGAIKAAAVALMVVGSAIGPAVSGYYIDRGVDFATQSIFIAWINLVIAGITWAGIKFYARA